MDSTQYIVITSFERNQGGDSQLLDGALVSNRENFIDRRQSIDRQL